MGHSTMQMTSRYAHLEDAALLRAGQKMAAHRRPKQKRTG
jgi:hypothetical protein